MKKLLIIFILIISAIDAEAQYLHIFSIDTTNFPLMKGKVYIADSLCNQIINLLPTDFELKEDGEIKPITKITCNPSSELQALSSVLVIDISSSLNGNGIKIAKASAIKWINSIPLGQSECAIMSFNSKYYINQVFTTDSNKLIKAVNSLITVGGTEYDNVFEGSLKLSETGVHKKVIIFITDGDAVSIKTNSIIARANALNCAIYTVIIGKECPLSLKEISLKTGGLWFENIASDQQAENIYMQILKTEQDKDPCTIEWESNFQCKHAYRYVDLHNSNLNLSAKSSYRMPQKGTVSLSVNPKYIYFAEILPGASKDSIIKIKANNHDIVVQNIQLKSGSSAFTIENVSFPFAIKQGEEKEIIVRYSPLDSNMNYALFEIETDYCSVNFSICGGFSRKKIKNPTLKLTHPNGGEYFAIGSDTVITWEGVAESDTCVLYYSLDSGRTWNLISSEATGNRYVWKKLPKPGSSQCLIKIVQNISGLQRKPGEIEWQKTYGGSEYDDVDFIEETFDGGYICTGGTSSKDGDVTTFKGGYDIWLVKLDSHGKIEWEKTYGGSNGDYINNMHQTLDSGFIFTASTFSKDGDIIENKGMTDAWIVKLDSQGKIEWQKTYGGSQGDGLYDIVQTFDGGYICIGGTDSKDGDILENKGMSDAWIVKLDSQGKIEWQKTYGGSQDDGLNDIVQTFDGGYIVGGVSTSTDGDILDNKGGYDIWVVKIDSFGNMIWEKTYGGSNDEGLYQWGNLLTLTLDGSYILSTQTNSSDGDVNQNKGSYDAWVVSIDPIDNIIWAKTYGGSDDDLLHSLHQTQDGGYVFCGTTISNDGDITENKGLSDAWVVKLYPESVELQSDISDSVFTIFRAISQTKDIDMKQCFVGQARDSMVQHFISNISKVPTQIDSIAIIGEDQNQFGIESNWFPFIIDPYQTRTVIFRFNPKSAGLKSAKVYVYTPTDTLITNIYGEGVLPQLSIVNQYIDFGKVTVGEHFDTLSVATIKNIGNTPLTITNTKHNYPNSVDFTTIAGGGSFILAPGETKTMDLRFTANSLGLTNGTLDFEYSGLGSPVKIFLTAEGIKPKAIISAESYKSNILICNKKLLDSLKIKNIGGDTLKIKTININGADASDFMFIYPSRMSFAEQDSITIKYIFSPLTPGNKNAYFEIISNSKDINKLIVPLNYVYELSQYDVVSDVNLGLLSDNQPKDTIISIKNTGSTSNKYVFTITEPGFDITPKELLLSANQTDFFHLIYDGKSGISNDLIFTFTVTVTDTICNSSKQIYISAITLTFQNLIIEAGIAEAKIGENFSIPIYLKGADFLKYTNASSINAELVFNKTLLLPEETSTTNGNERIMSLSMPIANFSNGVLAQINMQAALGNAEETDLKLRNVVIIGDTFNFTTKDGKFKLLDVCKEGGSRLINPNGTVQIASVSPNPSENYFKVDLELIENSGYRLIMVNSIGQKVFETSKNESRKGIISEIIDISRLSSGIYNLILETETVRIAKIVSVIK